MEIPNHTIYYNRESPQLQNQFIDIVIKIKLPGNRMLY